MPPRLSHYLGLVRFSHTVFALPFALSSAAIAWDVRFLADGRFDARAFALDLLGILLAMVAARSAAMAFNRLADRHIDAKNPRTATRHLPAGLLTPAAVAVFFLLCSAAFVASTLLFVASSDNFWPLRLAVPVLVFLCLYSLTKRFTPLAHFWLGASLMLAPVAAWIAVRGLDGLAGTPLVLGLAVLFWVAGFDILYACQDADFDRAAGLHSLPARLGIPASLKVALACHLVMLVMLVLLYFLTPPLQGVIYPLGVAAVALLVLYEHWLVRPDDLTRVNRAFFHVNTVISLGMLAVVLAQLLFR